MRSLLGQLIIGSSSSSVRITLSHCRSRRTVCGARFISLLLPNKCNRKLLFWPLFGSPEPNAKSIVHSLAQLLFYIVVVGEPCAGHFHEFSLVLYCMQGTRFALHLCAMMPRKAPALAQPLGLIHSRYIFYISPSRQDFPLWGYTHPHTHFLSHSLSLSHSSTLSLSLPVVVSCWHFL